MLGQGFADGPSQTAHDLMFFTDDDGPRFSRTSTDRIQVQRFDRVEVDDAGRNTFPGQFIRRRQGFMDHEAVGEEGHITPIPEDGRLIEVKRRILIGDDGRRIAAKADI